MNSPKVASKTSWATASQPNFASRAAELPSTSLSKTYGLADTYQLIRLSWLLGRTKNQPTRIPQITSSPFQITGISYFTFQWRIAVFHELHPWKLHKCWNANSSLTMIRGVGIWPKPAESSFLRSLGDLSLSWCTQVYLTTLLPPFFKQTPSVCSAFGLPLSLTLWVKRPWFSVGASGVEKTQRIHKKALKKPIPRKFWRLTFARIST